MSVCYPVIPSGHSLFKKVGQELLVGHVIITFTLFSQVQIKYSGRTQTQSVSVAYCYAFVQPKAAALCYADELLILQPEERVNMADAKCN